MSIQAQREESMAQDVKVDVGEVLLALRDNGEFRKALLEIAEQKAKGAEIGKVELVMDEQTRDMGNSLIAREFGAPRVIDYDKLVNPGRIDPGRLAGFADTTW
jgi:hypothetical protein